MECSHSEVRLLVSFRHLAIWYVLQLAALRVRSDDREDLELLVQRHELAILRRRTRRPAISSPSRRCGCTDSTCCSSSDSEVVVSIWPVAHRRRRRPGHGAGAATNLDAGRSPGILPVPDPPSRSEVTKDFDDVFRAEHIEIVRIPFRATEAKFARRTEFASRYRIRVITGGSTRNNSRSYTGARGVQLKWSHEA
jgi:hypothetical protein